MERFRDFGHVARSAKAGDQFAVSVSYVVKARQRRDRTGEARALKPRQVQVRRLAGHGEALRGRVAEKSDTTLAKLCAWLRGTHGVSVGMTALWRELARLGLTLKIVAAGRRAKPAGPPGCPCCLARGAARPEPELVLQA